MNMGRLLLPFTHGVDMQALEFAVSFAHNHHASLVALVLIAVPQRHRTRDVRLEMLQQAQDFLAAVSYKATKYGVAIEQGEIVTENVVEQMIHAASLQQCDSLLLFMRETKGVLLQAQEIKALLEQRGPPCYLVHLPSTHHTPQTNMIIQRFWVWLSKQWIDGSKHLSHHSQRQEPIHLVTMDYAESVTQYKKGNYSGTPLWPPTAALKKKGEFVGTPHAPAGGRQSPCTPSDRSYLLKENP